MRIFNSEKVLVILLTALSGVLSIPSNAQNWQRVRSNRASTRVASQVRNNKDVQYRQPANQARTGISKKITDNQSYNIENNGKPAIRGSINYSASPMAESSIYPIIRENSANGYSNAYGSWNDLGNGAKIYHGTSPIQLNQDNSANKLSPEVLETIRQLKSEYPTPTPMYQMSSPSTPATEKYSNNSVTAVSAKKPNGLMNPGNYQEKTQTKSGVDVESSTLTFPPGKNIRIRSLDFRQTLVADALRSLARIININLMLSSEIPNQSITVLFNDVTMEEAFNTILVNFDLSFSWEGKILRIFPTRSAPVFTRIFTIQHTNAADLEQMVTRLLSERGKLELDPRTNAIIITDTLAKLTEIENMLPKIDVKETSLEITSRPVTEVFYLNYADAGSIEEAITMISENAKISKYSRSAASQAGAANGGASAGRLDMMIITDTLNNLDRIRELIDKLDVAPIQVTIDAHIYEIDKQKETQYGVDWRKVIPVDGTSATNLFDATLSTMGSSESAGGTGVFRFGSLSANQFQVILSTLNTNSFAKVLSNPVITTLNNRTANISVGQQISYISASNVSENGTVTSTVSQADANIVLNVTPSVTGNDEVFMDIKPSIKNVLGYTELGGNQTPNLTQRTAETQVICKDNHTIVIGGMMKTDKTENVTKVPFFSELPGVGKLFRRKTSKEITTELIIFITPHIVRSQNPKPRTPAFSNISMNY